MSQCSGYALVSAIVECHHAAIAQWQLYLALALLSGHLACHRAVYLIGEPVFACYGLQLQHTLYIFVYAGSVVGYVFVCAYHSLVFHHCLG